MEKPRRWIEFRTNCRAGGIGTFRLGDVVSLPAEQAIMLVNGQHAFFRYDLEPDSPEIQKPANVVTTELKSDISKVQPESHRDSLVHNSYPPKPIAPADPPEDIENVPEPASVKPRSGTGKTGVRKDWLSMSQALSLLGWADNSGNRVKLRTLIAHGEIRGEPREGVKPVWQIDKLSLNKWITAQKKAKVKK